MLIGRTLLRAFRGNSNGWCWSRSRGSVCGRALCTRHGVGEAEETVPVLMPSAAEMEGTDADNDGGAPPVIARLDWTRQRRTGFPEAVLAQGKTEAAVRAIARRAVMELLAANPVDGDQDHGGEHRAPPPPLIVTRVDETHHVALMEELQEWLNRENAELEVRWHSEARILVAARRPQSMACARTSDDAEGARRLCVVSAGTSDMHVAEEAAVIAELSRPPIAVDRIYDVGVAGLHRLLEQLPRLRRADVIICVAGMDGALPGVVSGLVQAPVISVPTSVGYGAAFGGVAPLLTMLNACAPGVTVVNIDNGFGAAAAAVKMLSLARKAICT